MKVNWRKILLHIYRGTRMQAVANGSFPALIETLCESKTTSHLVTGFNRSGLWPYDRSAASIDKCLREVEELADENHIQILGHGYRLGQRLCSFILEG